MGIQYEQEVLQVESLNDSGGPVEESDYFDTTLKTGWYSKPHGLITMLQDKRLSKSEYILMDFLLAFENRHIKADGTFWCTDKSICATRLLSSKTLVKARRGLAAKGLIEYKKGYSNHATDYRILINKSYYLKDAIHQKNTSN